MLSLPERIRGPRSKLERRRQGFDPLPEPAAREVKVERRSPAHRDFVRDHGCAVPGCTRRPIEVAHVRTGTGGGLGVKPSDRWTIPLCGPDADSEGHHREQHRIGEASFEAKHGIDMKAVARALVAVCPKRKLLKRMP